MRIIIKRKQDGDIRSRNLSRGERDYIRRQGIRDEEFDGMTELARKQWAEETSLGAYEENLKK